MSPNPRAVATPDEPANEEHERLALDAKIPAIEAENVALEAQHQALLAEQADLERQIAEREGQLRAQANKLAALEAEKARLLGELGRQQAAAGLEGTVPLPGASYADRRAVKLAMKRAKRGL